MARKVDTHGETISEEITEHKELMKHNPKFRAAMGKRLKGKSDRKVAGKR
jgi:hypothetical protein